MSLVKLRQDFDLLPLERILTHNQLDLTVLTNEKYPVLLLSQITAIQRDLIERLEQAGIYDTEDFLQSYTKLSQHLKLDQQIIRETKEKIEMILQKSVKTPTIHLPLPSNYALLAVEQTSTTRELGILWRGILTRFKIPRESYWNPIKIKLDTLMLGMNQPELIGRVNLNNVPHWLEKVVPVSTYVKNIPLNTGLQLIAEGWGLDTSMLVMDDQISKELIASAYLVYLARSCI